MLASLLYYAPVLIGCAAVWIGADVWERMEKRTARANELPATQSPADAIGARRRVKDTSPLRPVQ